MYKNLPPAIEMTSWGNSLSRSKNDDSIKSFQDFFCQKKMKNLLLDISNWSFDKKKERRIWNWHTARNHFRLLLYCPAFLWIFFFCLINLVQQGKKRLGISDHPLLIASNFVIHSYLSFLPKSTKKSVSSVLHAFEFSSFVCWLIVEQ